tara:strand:+ start:18052 stop:18834 length:783 start_codon:yes stop_codon:yes gene_type:complete
VIKRIAGVVTVLNDWAVQSIGYNKYRPLGRPEIIVQNLDRWQLEEIVITDISRTKKKLGPNFNLLRKLSEKKIATPLTYIGGIRNVSDAVETIKLGADRIGIENLIKSKPNEIKKISDSIGSQALILAQSVHQIGNTLMKMDYLNKKSKELDIDQLTKYLESASELLLIDWKNEGFKNSFNETLLKHFENKKVQIICFGGISDAKQISSLLNKNQVSAIGIGNFLNYKELGNWNLVKKTNHESTRQLTYGKLTQGAKEWF